MRAYYNELNPHAAQWIRNLIAAGVIAPGDVDERSIEDVRPDDLRGYTQCHFFAGIAGWAYALDLAGWPRDRPVWTGSCPCQPFSAAGKGAGFEDERHLWPAWQHLIAQCKPPVVFGEQVASKAAAPWIDLVHADLEGMGYAFGCVPFPAASVGAPHIRDRNYWLAHADDARLEGWRGMPERAAERSAGAGGVACGLADTDRDGRHRGGNARAAGRDESANERTTFGLADTNRRERDGLAVLRGDERDGPDAGRPEGFSGTASRCDAGAAGPVNGHWRAADWLGCRDGKWRPVEPGTFPLATGVSGRVGLLRGYGNAIVPAQAAEFVMAYMEARCEVQAAQEAA